MAEMMSLVKAKNGVPWPQVKRAAQRFTAPAFCEICEPVDVGRQKRRFCVYDKAQVLPTREGLTETNMGAWVVWEEWHFGPGFAKSEKRRDQHLAAVKELLWRLRRGSV